MLEHNVEIARTFKPVPPSEMDRLRQAIAPSREGLEKNLVGHHDGPTRLAHLLWA
jgi:hypothetical protein